MTFDKNRDNSGFSVGTQEGRRFWNPPIDRHAGEKKFLSSLREFLLKGCIPTREILDEFSIASFFVFLAFIDKLIIE